MTNFLEKRRHHLDHLLNFQELKKPLNRRPPPTFKTTSNIVTLKDSKTIKHFRVYNRTLCFRSGVNDRLMLEEKLPDRCICSHGWHGSDCGQPEVAWRAIMASKQNVKLRRRKNVRRVVHFFCLDDYDSAIAEAAVEELFNVVDLFVICDWSTSEDNFHHRMTKGLLQLQQRKILYINATDLDPTSTKPMLKYIWDKMVKKAVRNLRDDDVYVVTNSEQILNSKALMFLKLYDGWPQPIGFRLRWSVFGFFWQHPTKTTIVVGAYTIGLANSSFVEDENLGLVIGDLNHYGGWYCHYCESPANIVNSLNRNNNTRLMMAEKNMDVPFIEDLIGGGIWLDGKTNLLRASKSREPYFAPEIVLNETWKYDWLVENFYAKLDYY